MNKSLLASQASHAERRAGLWIAALLLNSLLLYALLAWLFWLPTWLPRARVSIGTVTNRGVGGLLLLALTGVSLYALYAIGALLLWSAPAQRRNRMLVWGSTIAASALLCMVYPVTSTDVFDYFFRSRMAVQYGANPYLALPNQFKSDPFFRYLGWPNAPSAYGPLWELLSLALVRVGGAALQPNLLLYKVLAIGSHLLSGVVIGALVQDTRLKTVCVYLWLWSPLALWELAAVGHNDGLLVLSLLVALWAAQHDRYWLAVLVLTAGTLVKFLPAVFLPLVVLYWMRREATWAARSRAFAIAVALFAIPTLALYALYWDVPQNFQQLDLPAKFAAFWQGRGTTLRNLSVREGFLNAAPLAVLSYTLQTPTGVGAINQLLALFGLPVADKIDVRNMLSTMGTLLLVLGVGWQSWQIWFRHRALQPAFLGLLLWYIIAGSQWFQPWYVLWPLAIFALRPTRVVFAWLTTWAMMAQASYLLQYILLPNLKLSGQTLQAQIYYLLLIYGVPLVVWLVLRFNRSGGRSQQTEHIPAPNTSVKGYN